MRHVLRERRVGPGFHLDLLVADVRSDRALEDIERLIFARVDMDRRFVARTHPPFDDCPVAAWLLTRELELPARAPAAGPGTARPGARGDRVPYGPGGA